MEIDNFDGTRSIGHIREMPETPAGSRNFLSDSITASLTTSNESLVPSPYSSDRGVRRLLTTSGNIFRLRSKPRTQEDGSGSFDSDDDVGEHRLTNSARSTRSFLGGSRRNDDDTDPSRWRAKSTGRAESIQRQDSKQIRLQESRSPSFVRHPKGR